VLVSLGTTLQQQHVAVPVILEALAALPVRALLTTADLPLLTGLALPRNAAMRGFVPHEKLLALCRAGHLPWRLSTVSTALAFGVPMVCLPQGRKQPLNARRLEQVGAGKTLEGSAGVDAIRAAVSAVLASPEVRSAAHGFADPNPGTRAIDLVEKLLA
jgi:UDP:flavonoid glycosyltransferase YjiC (YdhE family)